MKVGIEVQRLFRKQKFGIEMSALQLLKKFQQLFPETEFVVFAKDDADKDCISASANMRVKTLAGKAFFDFEHIFLPIAAKHEQVDLLHCTGNTTPIFSPVPIVQTLHDVIFMDPISRNDTLYQRFGNHYRRKIVPVVTNRSHSIITVSNYEKERIINKLGIDEKRIRVIYNGIDENRFKVHEHNDHLMRVKKKYKLPEAFILFLGNTASRKNAPRVIEAYANYTQRTEQPLPLVTPGLPKEFIQKQPAVITNGKLIDNILPIGYVADEDLPLLYTLSTVFLYPSLSEGFGMPLVEAMACGAPVITSSISCLPEIAGDAAVLINPVDVTAMAHALTRLASDHQERHNYVLKGIQNARRFSWTKTAEQVYEEYERVLFHTHRHGKANAQIIPA